MRRIGVLMLNDENDPAGKVNLAGFTQGRWLSLSPDAAAAESAGGRPSREGE
jgi:hypothetical protein